MDENIDNAFKYLPSLLKVKMFLMLMNDEEKQIAFFSYLIFITICNNQTKLFTYELHSLVKNSKVILILTGKNS